MKTIQRITAISLVGILGFSTSQPVRSQAQLLVPAACATGVGCVLVGTVVVAGIAYYVWQHRQTGKKYYMAIDEPDELDQWGVYRARDENHCRYLAAGRPYRWSRGKCYIKG